MNKYKRSILISLLLTSILLLSNLPFRELDNHQDYPNKKLDVFNEFSPIIKVTAPPKDQSLVFGAISSPTDLDPHLCYDSAGMDVISQICEGLYKFNVTNPAYPLVPVLATDLPSVSGLEITIPLRSDVTFSDGTPFWATTAKWNFDRLNYFLNYSGNQYLPSPFNVPLPSDGSIQLSKVYALFTENGIPIINKTEVIGPYTLKIVLNLPKASFINLLTFHSTFFHSPISAQIQGKELDYLTYADGDVLIGTGPFKFQDYFTDFQVKFTRNEDYWQEPSLLTNLTFWIIEDDTTLNTAVLSGDIDLFDSPRTTFFDQFRNDPDITLLEAGPNINTNYMGFNGYMVNTTFRKAISYAIDYSYLIDTVLSGEAYKLKSPIPTGIPMSNYSYNYAIFDRAYAQSIMQSMGYGVGFTTDSQWATVADGGGWGFGWNITAQSEGTVRRDLALSISDNLRYLGINAPVVQVSFWDIINCMSYDTGPLRRDLIPMYMLGWAPDYIDPENYITPLYSNTSAIWVNTYDYELEQLMLAGETTVDITTRKAIYNEIQQKLLEELYFFAWISVGKNYDVYQDYVKGWVPNAIYRLDFHSVYIDITTISMVQSLNYGTIVDPTDLDPHLSYDTAGWNVISQICEGLYKFNFTDPASSLVPVLATALPTVSPDGLNITIPLRTGVKFQDGTNFNATAAKWNFDRVNYFLNYSGNQYLTSPFNVPLPATSQLTKVYSLFTYGGIPIINRTEVIGPYIIRIVLNMPKASIINLLAFPSTLMQSPTSAQIQGKELDYLTYADGDVLIGTGPFILQNYQEDVQVKFIGNPNYWQGAPQLTNLTFWTIEDDIALNTAVLAGDIDLYDSPGISFLDQFRNDPYTTLLEAGPTVNTNYMGFNGYMVNTTFRKAISYAINYSYLIDVVLEGRGYRLKSPIPTGIPMSNYSFNYPIFDRAYAQSIMQSIGFGTSFTTDAQWLAVAAGGGWGFGWNITVQTEGTTRRDLALYISDCLKYLGIDAPVVQVPFWNLIECMMDLAPFSREMIPMYMLGWAPDYYDPENYITPLFSNISAIWVNTYDYELEQLILAGETTVDIAAREIIYNQIQKKLVEELYFHVWISTGKNYDVYQNHVHGWVPNTHNRLDFYSIYIEEEYWILNPIIIDDTGGGDFTWAQAVSQSWCNGSGTSSDPYVIEKIKINGKDSESCIDIRNSDVHFIIKNSVFYNSGDSNYDAGIRLENISNGTLFNNNCSNNNGNGIALINCINNTISGNIVYQNNYAGIVLSSSNKSIVSGNTVYLNNLHGISIEDSIMNEISGNTAYNNSYNGIFLTYCNNSRILGNTIYNNYQNGIYVWYSNYSIISENTAYNHPWKGIRLEYSKNNDVIGNVVYESIEDGIYLYYSDENQISGNNAYDNLNGIYLWVSNDNNLIKNTLYNNDDNGIGLYDCDNTFIIGNILNMNGLNPYYASLGNNNFFRWNLADGYTDPIVFDDAGGGDFTWVEAKNQLAWFSGSGTGIDPYIIENIIVNGQNSGSCIEIINSNAYLIIRNCKFTNSGSGTSDAGIKLVYVTAAATEIINVDCSYNNGYGIYLTYCQGINIRNCIINNNARDGIALFNSNNNYIEYNDNTVNYNNGNGIFLNSSHYNEINNNIINYNSVGIYFNGSNYNTISFNDLQFNTIEAVVLKGVCIGNIFSGNNPPISIGGDGDGDGEFPLWIIILVIVGIIALVAIGGGVLVLKKRSTKPRKVEEEELIVGATLKEEKKLEKNRQKIEAKEKKIERDLQKKMSFVDYLIKEGKYRMALKNLNEIQEKAQASKLTELENRSKERRKLCEKLFEEKIEQEKLKEEERKEEVRLKTEKKLEKERLKEEEKREQIKKVLRIKISDLDYLIQENKIDLAIENLVKIQKEAQAQVLTDIVKEIEEKIISYKKSKLEIVNRIKQIILNLGAKFTRLQLIDISEKSGIKDEALIENVIQEMIKNKEIQGEYFSSSKALAIEVVSPVPVVEKEGLYHVFISYSTLDTEYFQISKIVRHLELYPEIKKVLFWEADSKQNIVEFMEETLKKTNAFVLFCSENSMKSEAVKGEWQAAYQMVKKGLMKMIPVYENEDHIPRLLWQMLNIKYTKDNFEEFIQKLYEEILR